MANQAARLDIAGLLPIWVDVDGRVVSPVARVTRQPERPEVAGPREVCLRRGGQLGWSFLGGRHLAGGGQRHSCAVLEVRCSVWWPLLVGWWAKLVPELARCQWC
jgi:hypothetical protein